MQNLSLLRKAMAQSTTQARPHQMLGLTAEEEVKDVAQAPKHCLRAARRPSGSRRRWRMGKGFAAIVVGGCFAFGAPSANAEASRVPAIVAVCAPCHGADGSGGDVEIPNLAGQKSIYIRQQLEAFRAGTRRHPDMKTVAHELTDREIDQLVVYYSTLVPR